MTRYFTKAVVHLCTIGGEGVGHAAGRLGLGLRAPISTGVSPKSFTLRPDHTSHRTCSLNIDKEENITAGSATCSDSTAARFLTAIRSAVQREDSESTASIFYAYMVYLSKRAGENSLYLPIIIYQMGKVGSSTIKHSLTNLGLPVPIYQVHFLSWKDILGVEDYVREMPSTTMWRQSHVIVSRHLRTFIDNTKGWLRWRIISLVRDPIARNVSAMFENLDFGLASMLPDNEDESVEMVRNYILDYFHNYSDTSDYMSTCFSQGMKEVFNFDVYSIPFNKQSGYSIYRTPDADIMILKTEDLSQCCSAAFNDFMGIPGFTLANKNMASQKHYSDLYNAVLKSLAIPEYDLAKVYSSRCSKHFYTDEEIAEFKAKWGKRPDRN